MSKFARPLFKRQQAVLGRLNTVTEETVSGYKTVMAYNHQDENIESFNSASDDFTRTGVKSQILGGSMGPMMNFIGNVGYFLVCLLGAYCVIKGIGKSLVGEPLTVAIVIMFLTTTKQFTRPINEIANLYTSLISALAGAERVFSILDEKSEDFSGTEDLKCEDVKGTIQFHDVNFSYVEDKPVIKNFTTDIFHGTNAGDNTINNKGVKTVASNGNVIIRMDMNCSGEEVDAYLNESSNLVTALRVADGNTGSEWILEPLTEASMETSYFGAEPLAKVTDGTKYYTTMYTAFPYKLMDGVKAYYVQSVSGNKAKCVEISGVVPAYTAVILECNSTDPKQNRLVPNTRQVPSVVTPEDNLLKGVIDIVNGTTTSTTPEVNYRTANNQETMRVLNVNSKGVLGFYKYGGTYMNTNKAYLDVSSVTNAKSFTLEFVEGEATGISEVRTLDPQTIHDGYYYDLQGRRVENPTHGLYIINGKKVFIK
jgi:hypothetical protein